MNRQGLWGWRGGRPGEEPLDVGTKRKVLDKQQCVSPALPCLQLFQTQAHPIKNILLVAKAVDPTGET